MRSIEEHVPHLPVFTDDCFVLRWVYETAKKAK